MRVIGLDLSLASTGIACIFDGHAWADRIRIRAIDDYPAQLRRIRRLRSEVCGNIIGGTTLVVVEGLAHDSRTGQALTRAGMWHMIVDAIDDSDVPWVEVAPTAVKKYATGKGNVGKDEVLAAVIKRFPDVDVHGNDEADALVLAAIGADLLGEPLVDMPAAHRTVLGKLRPIRGA